MTLTTIGITALFAILLALAICFSSYRLYRVYLRVMGFLFGFTAVRTWGGKAMDFTNLPVLILALVFGVIQGQLACLLFHLGVAMPSVLLGMFVTSLLVKGFYIHPLLALALVAVCGLAGAVRQLSNLPGDPYLPQPEFKTPT